VQGELGQRDVIQAGEEYARENALVLAQAGEAVQIRPNYWRVRFALPQEGSGKLLELEFDSLARRVTRAQRIDIATGEVTPLSMQPSQSSPASTPGAGPPP
jgi:hypothetical protein